MLKVLSLAAVFACTTAQAQLPNERPVKITPEMLKLTYQPDEGDSASCTAKFTYPDNPYDFNVTCGEGSSKRDFSVHLAISTYFRAAAPKMKIEILYWVNHEGATTWLTFEESNPIVRYEASQSIKGEPASLRLELALNGFDLNL